MVGVGHVKNKSTIAEDSKEDKEEGTNDGDPATRTNESIFFEQKKHNY